MGCDGLRYNELHNHCKITSMWWIITCNNVLFLGLGRTFKSSLELFEKQFLFIVSCSSRFEARSGSLRWVYRTMIKFLCLISASLMSVTYSSSLSALQSGNWGHITFMVNPSKCYNAYYRSSYQLNLLYADKCHPDVSFQTNQMDWR